MELHLVLTPRHLPRCPVDTVLVLHVLGHLVLARGAATAHPTDLRDDRPHHALLQ